MNWTLGSAVCSKTDGIAECVAFKPRAKRADLIRLERLSGLGATTSRVGQGMLAFNQRHQTEQQPWDWPPSSLHLLGQCMREQLFPIVYAANKMDIAPPGVLEAFPDRTMVACMSDMELALRRAATAGLVATNRGTQPLTSTGPLS